MSPGVLPDVNVDTLGGIGGGKEGRSGSGDGGSDDALAGTGSKARGLDGGRLRLLQRGC